MKRRWVKWAVGAIGGLPLLCILLVLIVTITLVGILGGANQSQQSDNTASSSLPASVLAYCPMMEEVCAKYEMSDYVDLMLAIMAQESGGEGLDPMQASECGYNTRYPHSPNSIEDPYYSIECGVQHFRDCKNAAGVTSPWDMEHIYLALQGYNFGGGYITWALERGGYTYQNAVEFSAQQAKKLGWTRYGDVDYVSHVLRYYRSSAAMGDEDFQKLYDKAMSLMGCPYEFGMAGPSTFDCSGFICYILNQTGVRYVSRLTAQGLYDLAQDVQEAEAQPGDLVFFSGTYQSGSVISHVGLYIGNGQMIDCNDDGVSVSDISSGYWRSHLYGYGRI